MVKISILSKIFPSSTLLFSLYDFIYFILFFSYTPAAVGIKRRALCMLDKPHLQGLNRLLLSTYYVLGTNLSSIDTTVKTTGFLLSCD